MKAFATLHALPRPMRYLIVGGYNTVISYVLFVILYLLVQENLHYTIVLLLSTMLGTIHSTATFKWLVFRTSGGLKGFIREYRRSSLVYAISYALNAVLLFILVNLMAWGALDAQLLLSLVIAAGTYFVHCGFTFKP